MKKLMPLVFGLFFPILSFGQCMQVNIGVIIDKNADPCKGPITLDAEIPGMNYLWSTGQTTQKIVVTQSNVYTVIVDDGMGCTGKDTIRVTFLSNPTVDLGPDPGARCGGCFSLDAGNQSGASISWSTGETSQTINYCTIGTHKVWAAVTNNLGCSASDTIMLTIQPGYDPSLGNDITQCGDSAVLTSANLNGSYLWNTGETTPSITVHQSGNYHVTVSNMAGCDPSNSVSDTIEVLLHPNPQLDLGPDPAPQCGGCLQLDAGNQPGSSILWSTGQTSQAISYCTTGIQQVWASVTNANDCSSSDTVTLNIKGGYDPSLGSDITQCGNNATITSTNLGGSYLWSTGETTQQINVTASGTYYVTVSNMPGCDPLDTVSDTIQVNFLTVLSTPSSIIDLSGMCGDKKYTVNAITGATSYQWNVPQGWIIVQGQGTNTVIVKPNELSQGIISVSASNGIHDCSSRESILETKDANYTLHIPNTFSPNNDGINDVWVLRNIEQYPDNELIILNRWGNEVYRKKTYLNNWDGSELNEGTYFFKLKVKLCDEEMVITDYLTIVR